MKERSDALEKALASAANKQDNKSTPATEATPSLPSPEKAQETTAA
jgi:hypothetical protein